ncbi:hypothetical protein HAX54_002742 [Datura stramonium]|uniref:Uncharacterized protein n=1 Tax=Datura stramonium TaxID=4076 RepID=A0ABS8WVK5_DATST|nr:hypothetical protein [Datura stramonium]
MVRRKMKGGIGPLFSGFGGRQIWVFFSHGGCWRKQRRGEKGITGRRCFSGSGEVLEGEGGLGVAREIRWLGFGVNSGFRAVILRWSFPLAGSAVENDEEEEVERERRRWLHVRVRPEKFKRVVTHWFK